MMTNHTERQNLDYIARWEMIFEILSLERVQPFYSEMGLIVPGTEDVRLSTQQFVIEVEGLADGPIENEMKLVKQTLTRISSGVDELVQSIHRWGMEVFSFGDSKGYFSWAVLFRWITGLGSRHYPIVFPSLSKDKVEKIIDAIRNYYGDDPEIERRLSEIEQLPLSDWDQRIYRRYEAGISPLDSVRTTIENYQTQQIWEFVRKLLVTEEIEILLIWGRTHASHLNMRPESIRIPLPH